MKNVRRWLAVLMCTLLLTGMLPANAEQFEELEEAVEAAVEEENQEQTPEQAEDAPEDDLPVPEEHMDPEPSSDEAVSTIAEDEPVIDTTRDARYSPTFVKGYALVLRDSFAYPDPGKTAEASVAIDRESVVYVSDRRTTNALDRLQVSFSSENRKATTVWMDAEALRPLNEQEVEAFIEKRVREKDVEFYKDDRSLPLALVKCLFREDYESAQKANEIPAEAEEQTEVPELIEEVLLPVEPQVLDFILTEDISVEAAANEADSTAQMTLPVSALTLGVGETFTLTPEFSDGAAHPVKYASAQVKTASVSADGVIKGVRAGTTTIGVVAEDGQSAEVQVTVKKAPTSVSISPKSASLGVGDSGMLTVKLSNGSTSRFSFVSDNPAVVSVDGEGRVTALSGGTAKVTVETFNRRHATATFTVYPAPEAITLAEESLILGQGATRVLKATITEGSRGTYTFVSDNTSVALVDSASGLLTAIAPGTANITVTTQNGKSDTCAVTVVPAPTAIAVAETALTLGVGQTAGLAVTLSGPDGCAAELTYASSHPKVASVSATGEIKALRTGSATIGVRTHNGLTASVVVTVKRAPGSVKISPANAVLGVGEHGHLAITLPKNTACGLAYSDYDADIISIAADGEITALREGSTRVTVRTHNNKSASCAITVQAAPTAVTLSDAEKALGVGQSYVLQAAPNSAGAYSFSSSDAGVAAVDPHSGEIRALAQGTATITVTTYNGVQASCALTVLPAPTQVVVTPAVLTLGVGETVGPLHVDLGAGCAGSYALKSSNARIAAVSPDGQIKALRSGSAKITVTTHNGLKATVQVSVKAAPKAITMTPANVELGVGERSQLSWTVSKNSAGGVTLLDYDTQVISVSADNTVTALAEGTTQVTVRTYNGKQAACTVTVKPAPTEISLTETEKILGVGQSFTLRAQLNSAGARSFRSTDANVAAVDAVTGTVRATGQGTAEIIAEAYNGVSASCTVTVKPAPSRVSVTPNALVLGVGEIVGPLRIDLGEGCEGSYTLKSSSAKVAAVNEEGLIKAMRAGSATITVTTHNGLKATVKVTVKAAPKSIALNPASATLSAGETVQLYWTLDKKAAGGVIFTDYDGDVISVSESGLVTAIAPGSTTVTARTFNGKEARCSVTVLAAPERVSLEPAELTLGAGESALLGVVFDAGTGGKYTLSSDNEAVARVNSQTGVVTAVGAGTANLRVTVYNGISATCAVRVSAAPTGVHFQEESLTLAVGDSYQLMTPVVEGEGGSSSLVYSSSNAKYLTVSGDGRITALRAGSILVKVSTYNGKSDSLRVQIQSAPSQVWFSADSAEIGVGETFAPEVRFTNGMRCSYALSVVAGGEQIIRIDEDGKTVRGLQPGMAEIRATAFNGVTATLKVDVMALPERVTLNVHEATLGQRETLSLQATLPEHQSSALSYASSDPNVAEVDEKGQVRAVNPGSAEITVRTANDKTDVCRVTVLAAPTGVSLAPATAVRSLEESSLQLRMSFPHSGMGGGCTYTSSDPAVATVSTGGLVRFVSTGTVEITVRTYNNYTAVSTITIAEAPGGIAFAAPDAKVALGDITPISVSFTSGGGSYTLAAEDTSVASVEGEAVRGLQIGSTTLTATTYNGLTATCTVTVVAAPTALTLDASELELSVGEERQLVARTNAVDGLGSCTFVSENPEIASVNAQTGAIVARALGETTVTATTYDGLCSAACLVRVTGAPTYRALVLGEYADSTVPDSLPFAINNVEGVAAALRLSSREGVRYASVSTGVERGKSGMLSAIRSEFASAKPFDVSVIYIVAHGQNHYGLIDEYVLGTTDFGRSASVEDLVTATELMAALETVPGRVVLVLDSCYSGAFLDKYGAAVSANPNLSVICSAHGDTRSSYWNVTGSNSVDFFTYALLEGLGYEEKTHATLPLNADTNGDGSVTVAEAAAFASMRTLSLVAQYASQSRFHGSPEQSPTYSIGGMESVPLIGR